MFDDFLLTSSTFSVNGDASDYQHVTIFASSSAGHASATPYHELTFNPDHSMGADQYDNALAETIYGFYKAEVIHRRGPWRSIDAVEYATLEWVDWFNNRRLLEPIGNIPPAEAEAAYYACLEKQPIAA